MLWEMLIFNCINDCFHNFMSHLYQFCRLFLPFDSLMVMYYFNFTFFWLFNFYFGCIINGLIEATWILNDAIKHFISGIWIGKTGAQIHDRLAHE